MTPRRLKISFLLVTFSAGGTLFAGAIWLASVWALVRVVRHAITGH